MADDQGAARKTNYSVLLKKSTVRLMYVFDADREKLVRNRLEIMARVSYFDQLGLETSPYIRLPHSFRLAERD